ncbi:hypothetical protein [Sphaerisporangium aureirubrum]|uniref:Uncharacterized protein n=1 Tax=Sphaerisporangium aureirubrum TaxID=1544736 RepID=A0ABW1NTT0_9ACTN
MTFSSTQLDQDSIFEQYILDEVAPALFPQPASQVMDYRGLGGVPFRLHAFAGGVPARMRAVVNGRLTELDITPLVFGAAWKILDLTMDNILGPLPDGSPQRISKKINVATNANGPSPAPAPFVNETPLWKRFMHVYANTLDLRDSVVHRRLKPHSDGRLEATPSHSQTTPGTVMTREELESFFRAVQGFYTVLIRGSIRTRERDNLLFLLDQLQTHHRLGPLPGRPITRTALVLAHPRLLTSGEFEYDARPVMKDALNRWPTGGVDLLLQLPDGSILGGDLEDAPGDKVVVFTLNKLPKWLRELPASEWARWAARLPY